ARGGGRARSVAGGDWQTVRCNGTRVGETGITAALSGAGGGPGLLGTGDDAVCAEAKALLGRGLTTVSVKQGLGVRTARMLAPKRARELVEAGARDALRDLKAVEPYDPGKPCEVKVEYKSTRPPQHLRYQANIEFPDD